MFLNILDELNSVIEVEYRKRRGRPALTGSIYEVRQVVKGQLTMDLPTIMFKAIIIGRLSSSSCVVKSMFRDERFMPRLIVDEFEETVEKGSNPKKNHLLRRLVKKVLIHSRQTIEIWYALPNSRLFEDCDIWLPGQYEAGHWTVAVPIP